jgi:hypothetical protein
MRTWTFLTFAAQSMNVRFDQYALAEHPKKSEPISMQFPTDIYCPKGRYFLRPDVHDGPKQSKRRTAAFAVLFVLTLSGCISQDPAAQIEPTEPTVRQANLDRLAVRLIEAGVGRPSLAPPQSASPMEFAVIQEFADDFPGAVLQLGATPTLNLDIDREREVLVRAEWGTETIRLTYRVALVRRDTGQIVVRSEAMGICIESDANMTVPRRCREVRPLVLRLALERLGQ